MFEFLRKLFSLGSALNCCCPAPVCCPCDELPATATVSDGTSTFVGTKDCSGEGVIYNFVSPTVCGLSATTAVAACSDGVWSFTLVVGATTFCTFELSMSGDCDGLVGTGVCGSSPACPITVTI